MFFGVIYVHLVTLNPRQFPTGTETFAVVIKRLFREELDWTAFRDPFSTALWKFLAVYSLLCTFVIRAVQYAASREAR